LGFTYTLEERTITKHDRGEEGKGRGWKRNGEVSFVLGEEEKSLIRRGVKAIN